MQREMWSMSKPKIKDNARWDLDEDQLSHVDTVNFFVYGLSQFFMGALGDAYPLNRLLPISYFLQACCYVVLGFCGLEYIDAVEVYFACFTLIGFTQSICFPAGVGISGAWFSKENRGLAVNGFCVCQNAGNIVGAQFGAFLLRIFPNWGWLFICCSGWFVLLAVL